jgi:hypothetical protein
MKQNKLFNIDAINVTLSDEKLLTQIWRDEYPDCASLEEVLRRLLLQKVKKEVKIRSAFNMYKKMRKNAEPEEIFKQLKEKKLPGKLVKKKMEEDKEKEKEKEEAKKKEEEARNKKRRTS